MKYEHTPAFFSDKIYFSISGLRKVSASLLNGMALFYLRGKKKQYRWRKKGEEAILVHPSFIDHAAKRPTLAELIVIFRRIALV